MSFECLKMWSGHAVLLPIVFVTYSLAYGSIQPVI